MASETVDIPAVQKAPGKTDQGSVPPEERFLESLKTLHPDLHALMTRALDQIPLPELVRKAIAMDSGSFERWVQNTLHPHRAPGAMGSRG